MMELVGMFENYMIATMNYRSKMDQIERVVNTQRDHVDDLRWQLRPAGHFLLLLGNSNSIRSENIKIYTLLTCLTFSVCFLGVEEMC